MLISRQFDFGGIGMLCDRLNTLLLLRREERKKDKSIMRNGKYFKSQSSKQQIFKRNFECFP